MKSPGENPEIIERAVEFLNEFRLRFCLQHMLASQGPDIWDRGLQPVLDDASMMARGIPMENVRALLERCYQKAKISLDADGQEVATKETDEAESAAEYCLANFVEVFEEANRGVQEVDPRMLVESGFLPPSYFQ